MTLAEQIEIACLMEATARKPGNVHPAAAFEDLTYDDFVRAAKAIAKPIAALGGVNNQRLSGVDQDLAAGTLPHRLTRPGDALNADKKSPHPSPLPAKPGRGGKSSPNLGEVIYQAVRATGEVTETNVNLGIVLLLVPLAAVPMEILLEDGIPIVLNNTTVEDADTVYAAIRLALPGGMGNASSQDLSESPTVTLREAMQLAVDRDRIAEQYCTDYRLVFEARRKLIDLMKSTEDWEAAVIALHVWMMSLWPDTLIARKCGWDIARQSASRAAALLPVPLHRTRLDPAQLAEFDCWLRADGHRRNPGTTADLVAATLFAALRDGLIQAPTRSAIHERANIIQATSTEKML